MTAIDTVRLLITDPPGPPQAFDDLAIGDLLDLNGSDPRRTAAQALEIIAANQVLLAKRIRTLDLQTDGPAVSAELRALAKALRGQADAADLAVADDTAGPMVAAGPCSPLRDWRWLD